MHVRACVRACVCTIIERDIQEINTAQYQITMYITNELNATKH